MSDKPHVPIHVEVHHAQPIDEESWLRQERFRWFRDGHGYASTQTHSITALSKCHPTELYYAVVSVLRGAKKAGHDVEQLLKDL